MLERAAGYLDFARPGFLQKYKGVYRGKKSLDSAYWRHQSSETDTNQLQCIFHHEVASRRNVENSLHSAHDVLLDLLYRRRFLSQDSCVSKSRKGNANFQKRNRGLNFTRAFSQSSHSDSQPASATLSVNVPRISRQANRGSETHTPQDYDKRLSSEVSLDRRRRDNDRMWKLWKSDGLDPKSRTRLIAQLFKSERHVDITRALTLLRGIDPNQRTLKDYKTVIHSLYDGGHLSIVEIICEEASTQGVKFDPWSLAIKIAFQGSRWDYVQHIWNKYDEKILELLPSILGEVSDFAEKISSFLEFLEARTATSADLELASFLLEFVFTSDKIMEEIPTETALSLTRMASNLNFLTQRHYTYAISTLLRIDTRPSKVMTLILYRNFRWHLNARIPPQRLLLRLLETLASIRTHHGVQYLLDEFSHFYQKPSTEAYKIALLAFSRSGDALKAQESFDNLVEHYGTSDKNPNVDHKTPRTPRWVAPLIHAYARQGDYVAAQNEFNKISQIYKVQWSVECWNSLIYAHVVAGHRSRPFRIFRRMQRMGVKPNWYTYGTLMGMCAKLGDIENTLALCQMAEKNHGNMPTALIDTVVEAYCRNKYLDEAEQVAEACLNYTVSGTRTRMWNRILWSYALRADLDSVSRIQNRMKEAGIDFDGMTYAAMMLCFVVIRQTNSARRLLKGLQRGRRIQATEFHYTLVLYGYVKENNRDMVYLVYKEMEQRFGNPNLTARILKLRSTLGRDTYSYVTEVGTDGSSDAGFRLTSSEDLLFQAIFEFDNRQFANRSHRPEPISSPLHEAFPSTLYEPVLRTYSSEGLHDRAEKLLREYTKDIESAAASGQRKVVPSLRFLSVLMEVYSHAGNFETVKKCWELSVQRALKMVKHLPTTLIQPATEGAPESASENISSDNSSQSMALDPSFSDDVSEQALNGSMTSLRQDSNSELNSYQPHRENPSISEEESIIPSQRFILDRHFSIYMTAVGKNGQASMLPKLVKTYQGRGFRMTSQNWLNYVRTLATSGTLSEQLEAFTTFERIFMPHFPGWRLIKRGVQLKPAGTPSTIDLLDKRPKSSYGDSLGKHARKLWSKLHPTWMFPTYNVMVYLSASLKDFRHRSLTEGREQLDTLYKVAPLTLETIEMMPYLPEKFQATLLRNQLEQGGNEPIRRKRQEQVWTGGILGVGGNKRPDRPVEEYDALAELVDLEGHKPTPKQTQPEETGIDQGEPKEHIEITEGIIEPQDEHDIETETLLRARKRALGGKFDPGESDI